MADAVIAHGITREAGQSNAVFRGMAKHPELCFVLLTVIFTFLSNYGTSFKSKPLVVPARLPRPLFPAASPVVDLYLGDLRPLVDMLNHEDLIFVMYYAPWCAKSQAVKFVAVNCWYPEGLCRKQYKFLLFPVFFAYHHNNDGYRYLGIERAEFMVKFLEDLLNPLTILRRDDNVKDFVTQHDTAVVGYFDFNSSPQPPGFQQFYFAAMRVVEQDVAHPVKFGVITDAAFAARWNLTDPSDIICLRINNSTLKYPLANNVTSSNIVAWVFEHRNRFKDLALRYHQCPDDKNSEDVSRRWLALSLRNFLDHAKLLNDCRNYKKGGVRHLPSFRCCVSTITEHLGCLPKPTLNVCEVCHHKPNIEQHSPFACDFRTSGSSKNDRVFGFFLPPPDACLNAVDNYSGMSHTSVCCKKCDKNFTDSDSFTFSFTGSSYRTSGQGRRATDRYVLDSLENLPRKLCDRISFQKSLEAFPSSVIPDFHSSSYANDFIGYGCRSNHSLNFITLDSHNHWMFAESLGLDVSLAHHTPVIVAFDKEREEQHVLGEKFSKKTTASFILNFTRGLLERDLRTIPPLGHPDNPRVETVYVEELNTHTFHASIEQPKDVVLLVYARWCGICMALSHTFLHLAQYFHTSPNITFVRINGENSDLPWEFSMDSYPTIIFFPAARKADSVAFPSSISMTLPNLIRFVLQHSTFTTRLHLAADVCSTTCVNENLDLTRHTLHALRSKLARLQLRAGKFGNLSHYQVTMKTFLRKQISEIRLEIDKVRTLKKFLEENRGKGIDRRKFEQLFQGYIASGDADDFNR
ncbi:hypothetical protein BaRGS_00019618 [Batillaria attramentaria]|uniref:Thioredoxin domain-containing protein n=1 Tax=Batillaria attramentaria TaxID=370345 RepID=A0ABD0KPN9_9CAEN